MVQSGEHLCEDLRPIPSSHEMLERGDRTLWSSLASSLAKGSRPARDSVSEKLRQVAFLSNDT